ncbi:hypothetical protein Btru_017583 [Bulinus truncatus]|nr:hypothetical protein Btru_017583 [Bulinus truncatus]
MHTLETELAERLKACTNEKEQLFAQLQKSRYPKELEDLQRQNSELVERLNASTNEREQLFDQLQKYITSSSTNDTELLSVCGFVQPFGQHDILVTDGNEPELNHAMPEDCEKKAGLLNCLDVELEDIHALDTQPYLLICNVRYARFEFVGNNVSFTSKNESSEITLCEVNADDYRYCNRPVEIKNGACGCLGKFSNKSSGAKTFRMFYYIKEVNITLKKDFHCKAAELKSQKTFNIIGFTRKPPPELYMCTGGSIQLDWDFDDKKEKFKPFRLTWTGLIKQHEKQCHIDKQCDIAVYQYSSRSGEGQFAVDKREYSYCNSTGSRLPRLVMSNLQCTDSRPIELSMTFFEVPMAIWIPGIGAGLGTCEVPISNDSDAAQRDDELLMSNNFTQIKIISEVKGTNVSCGLEGKALLCVNITDSRVQRKQIPIKELPKPTDSREISIQQVIFMVELFAVLSLMLWGISLFVEHIQLIVGYERRKLEIKRDKLFHVRRE